ncbi:MAG: hypothetical protein R2731_05915 [Nocardioides sp.]
MFSGRVRFVVTAARVCASAAAGVEATAATGGWDRPEVLARDGVATDTAVAATGDMAVAVMRAGTVRVVLRPAGGDWRRPVTLGGSGYAEDANVAYDHAGRLWLAWLDNQDRPTVLVRHSRPGGGWSKARVVASRARGSFTGLQLELGSPMRAAAAWRWVNLPRLGNGRLLLAERTPGKAWRMTGHVDEVWDLHLSLGGSGQAAVMMSRLGPGAVDETVTVMLRPAGASWSAPVELASIADSDRIIGLGTVAVDGAGTTTAVWRDRTDAGVWQVWAARADDSGTWAPPVLVGSRAAPNLWAPPRVLGTDAGVTVAIWNRADLSLVAARFVQGAWTDPVRVSGSDAAYWDAAADSTGRVVAVWSPPDQVDEPGYGVRASLMGRRGVWSPRATVAPRTARVLYPLAAMDHRDALAVWWHIPGDLSQVRGSTHLHR